MVFRHFFLFFCKLKVLGVFCLQGERASGGALLKKRRKTFCRMGLLKLHVILSREPRCGKESELSLSASRHRGVHVLCALAQRTKMTQKTSSILLLQTSSCRKIPFPQKFLGVVGAFFQKVPYTFSPRQTSNYLPFRRLSSHSRHLNLIL